MKSSTWFGLMVVFLVAAVTGCTREQEQPAAKPTAAPARIAATPVAQAPAAPEDIEDVEDELYVDLEGEPDEGPPPLSVKFTSTVEDGTPPYSYKWDFGDGTPASTDANPAHVYQKEGEFTVTLSVTDSKGIKGSEEYDILVENE